MHYVKKNFSNFHMIWVRTMFGGEYKNENQFQRIKLNFIWRLATWADLGKIQFTSRAFYKIQN